MVGLRGMMKSMTSLSYFGRVREEYVRLISIRLGSLHSGAELCPFFLFF